MELFALTSTTPKSTTTKYNADAQWSDEVNIIVPIVTMVVFVLVEALIYYVDDPGLRAKKRGRPHPEDYEDVEDEDIPTRVIVTTNFIVPPAEDVQVATWQDQPTKENEKWSEPSNPQPDVVKETPNEATVYVGVAPDQPSTSNTDAKAPDVASVDPQQSDADMTKVDI